MSNADAIGALFYPFTNGKMEWPGSEHLVLFLNASYAPALEPFRNSQCVFQQYFFPFVRNLRENGFTVDPEIREIKDCGYDYGFVLGSKQRIECCYFLAHAANKLKDNGVLVCAAANDAGGKRLDKQCKELGLEVESFSKHKCKIIVARKRADIYRSDVAVKWISEGSEQEILNGSFLSRPGVFSYDRVDKGSEFLSQYLPSDLKGSGADFGCGYGYLSRSLLQQNKKIKKLYCIDADYRAVTLCKKNLVDVAPAVEGKFIWDDLACLENKLPWLDWIVMNPPFHEGKKEAVETGKRFIITASKALRSKGTLWMVANAHLPYEDVLSEHFFKVEKVVEQHGFKIFCAVK